MLSAGVRPGSHRAQGPGRHQGAAAALISPKPAATFSIWSPSGEKEQEAGELEEEQKPKQGETSRRMEV